MLVYMLLVISATGQVIQTTGPLSISLDRCQELAAHRMMVEFATRPLAEYRCELRSGPRSTRPTASLSF